MKRIYLLVIFFGIWIQSFSQEYDKLIVDKDTISCQLKISHKKGEIQILFKKGYQDVWNEIFAANAEKAIVSDKSLFLSLKLPDTKEKVWTKCILDGTYKLLKYNDKYYVSKPDEIFELKNSNKENKVENTSNAKRFIGIMIYIFNNDIDYDFHSLTYDSRSLVKPLIKYHEAKKLPYHDYNHYVETKSSWIINGGISLNNYKLSNQFVKSVEVSGYSPTLSTNLCFFFPELSSRLSFSGGIEVSNPRLNALKIKSLSNKTYYFDLSYSGIDIAAPAMVGFKLIQNPQIVVSLGTGVKVMKGFVFDQNLRIEIEEDNIVETELATMENVSKFRLFHSSELLVGVPTLSNSISMGASYNYSLTNKIQEDNSLCLNRSLFFFARFSF